MAVQGHIKYSDLNSNAIEEMSMTLFDDTLLTASVDVTDAKNPKVKLTMQDIITSNIELQGGLDLEKLQVLLRNLNIIHRQLLVTKQNASTNNLEGGNA